MISPSRAAAARMWPAWCYLTWVVPLASARNVVEGVQREREGCPRRPLWQECTCVRADVVDVRRWESIRVSEYRVLCFVFSFSFSYFIEARCWNCWKPKTENYCFFRKESDGHWTLDIVFPHGIQHARAAVARMWPAWFYLIGIRDPCKKLILDQRMCTAWYYLTRMRGGSIPGLAGMVWIHMENEHVVRIIYEFPIEKPAR